MFQETWVRLARHARRLAPDTDLAAWLFRVARNAWISHARWALLDLSRWVAFDESVLPAPENANDQDRAEAARRIAGLERALSELPWRSREVLLLVAVEGFAQDQAAQILGISYEALRQRLSRARGQLARRLETDQNDDEAAR